MAGILRVVATPIGNLQDFSPRALDALKSSTVILAENISHSRKLLTALKVNLKNIRLLSCSQHQEESRIKETIEGLKRGEIISLISDAGAPTISDPGGRIVEAVIASDLNIEVFPGPSAVIAALMGAGIICTRFAFLGFLSKKAKERETMITDAQNAGLALVIYEAPNRVLKTLDDLLKWCGPKRVVVARELTKKFETFHRGILGQELKPEWINKGEAVIIVECGEKKTKTKLDPNNLDKQIETILQNKILSLREMAKIIATKSGISSKEAYTLILKQRK